MPAGVPRQINARHGSSVFYKGKTLLSTIDPIKQAERLADTIPIQERTLYVCPSPLYGYGIRRLAERITDADSNSAILCIEDDENLFRISREYFTGELQSGDWLQLINAHDEAAVCGFVRQHWGKRHFRRVRKVCFTAGWQLSPELYDALIDALRRSVSLDWGNALTLTKLGRLYIRNTLTNLALVSRYPSITRFSFGKTPVLVLGAGPGLDPLLDGLRRHFGDTLDTLMGALQSNTQSALPRPFRIVCADTCLKTLYARNIKPDLTVALESQHWNLGDFVGLGDWVIPAAIDLSALPASARLPGLAPRIFFTPWTELRLFDRLAAAGLLPAVFPPLGSVGLSATAIALRISSGPVLIGGMDFSFSMDSSHARSTPPHLKKLEVQNRFTSPGNAAGLNGAVAVQAKNGAQVLTNPAMRNYRDIFSHEFAADAGQRLFDMEGPGLPLGIQTLPEKDFFKMLETGKIMLPEDPSQEYEENPEKTENNNYNQHIVDFIQNEKTRLLELMNILTGKYADKSERQGKNTEKLEILIDECDYLWAHFPDYAETGGKRPNAAELAAASPRAISFLKRLRAEIDPVLKIFDSLLMGN